MRFTADICENDAHYLYPILLGESYKSLGDCTLEECIDKLGQYEDIDENPSHLEKIKKAFEIFVDKDINIGFLQKCNSVDEYNDMCEYVTHNGVYVETLTQEEYDLLKEVL